MADHRTIHSLGFEKPNEPYFFGYDEGPPSDGEVRLETLYSGFSAGTELTFLKNTNPYLHSRWDEEIGVFVEGEPSAHYPMPFLGYMEVARVSDSHTQRFVAGDIVAATYAHKSGHTANSALDVLIPMPVGLDPILGVFVAQMGPIAANGVLHADVEIYGEHVPYLGAGTAGRPVVIWGGGTVGFLSALFARKAGAAEVLIAEPSPFRRKIAENLGFLALPEEQAWRYAKERWHNGGSDRGADFVFQTRPQANSLHLALRALRPQGTVIDLAFYQGGADGLRLGEEFHHNGLNLKCAQISRVPRGLGYSWDRRRLAQETIALLQSDREAIGRQLITHVVPFSDAPAFLKDLVRTRPDFVQIVFAADQ